MLALAFKIPHREDPYWKFEDVKLGDTSACIPERCSRAGIHRQRGHLCDGIPSRGTNAYWVVSVSAAESSDNEQDNNIRTSDSSKNCMTQRQQTVHG